MAQVALYLPAPADRHGALEAIHRTRIPVFACPTEDALLASMGAGNLPWVAVTTLRDECGRRTEPLIRRLRATFPELPIVGYAALNPQAAGDIVAASKAGLTHAALRGHDDLGLLVQAVTREMRARPDADIVATVLEAVDDRLTPTTRPIVRYCLTNAQVAPAVEQVAAALCLRRQTVAGRLSAAMLPTASALVSWGRLLLAARLLENAERSVEHVAHALAFDSGSAFRHMLMRYTGLRTAEVRARGGLAEVLPRFVGAMGGVPMQAIGERRVDLRLR